MGKIHGFYGGKFMPMHKGHLYCIDTAARMCDDVVVIMFINGDYDGINEIKNEKLKMKNVDGRWYDLRGRQVQGRPSSGVYIMTDGKHIRKVAIK